MSQVVHRDKWTAKGCDVCGRAGPTHTLGRRSFEFSTRAGLYAMDFDDVACGVCGFVFSGTAPSDEFLFNFYKDCHALASEFVSPAPSFDLPGRVRTVQNHVAAGGRVLEVGAASGEFSAALRAAGYETIGVDPLEQSGEEGVVTGFFGDGRGWTGPAVDAVVSYYVLEHVRSAGAWLAALAGGLERGGTLILEVPDFGAYPEVSLNHEHLLHFTPTDLARLLGRYGFEVIERPQPTRYFGFCMVARLVHPDKLTAPDEGPAIAGAARQCFALGLAGQSRRQEAAVELAHAAAAAIKAHSPDCVVFWGANIYAVGIAEALRGLTGLDLYLADNSATKIGTMLAPFEQPIIGPNHGAVASGRPLFLLCSPLWNAEIRAQIKALRPDVPGDRVLDAAWEISQMPGTQPGSI